MNITKITLSGVEAAIEKHMAENTEYKGVKAHFRVDESGILNLEEVSRLVLSFLKWFESMPKYAWIKCVNVCLMKMFLLNEF